MPIDRRHHRRGFTLTELLISLAMVALLLVGISRIFGITGQTIGAGQALSKAVRAQRAVGQVLASDILGTGLTASDVDTNTGMTPLVSVSAPDSGAPFLTISNFRVAAYLNAADATADVAAPTDAITGFAARSLLIRGIDLDKDGVENSAAFIAGGETLPLYQYGERNFRCDTVGFFANGKFHSTADTSAVSNAAFIWYGHLRVFNSHPAQLGYTNAYGAPGDFQTPTTTAGSEPGRLPNSNNRYAEQFILGRYQMPLIDMADHDNDATTDITVVANGDPSKVVSFGSRTWLDPDELGSGNRPIPSPFNFAGQGTFVHRFNQTTKADTVVDAKDVAGGASLPKATMPQSRYDVLGVSFEKMRERIAFVEDWDRQYLKAPENAAFSTTDPDFWWEYLSIGWTQRFYVNPFISADPAAGFSNTDLAQRKQILATSCTQFIVEYAGDFVTQNVNGVVETQVDAITPDGVTDFVVLPGGVRQTRFYGLPRDINGDGHIYSTVPSGTPPAAAAAIYSSQDVVPLRDLCGARQSFERYVPDGAADYSLVISETNNSAKVPRGSTVDTEDSSYVCVWGTREAETAVPYPAGPNPTGSAYRVPQLLRIIVEIRDPDGKLKDGISQEYVFAVPQRK